MGFDLNTGDYILPNFGGVAFDISATPKYVSNLSFSPMSINADVSFECDINVPAFEKLAGLDSSGVRSASVTFESPYQVQKRRHKKKRINKKWAKRYGYKTMFKSYTLNDVLVESHEESFEIIGRPNGLFVSR